MTRATMKDIAAEAGVSQATVSLVLNHKDGNGRVSPETADRVREVAEKLSFRKNVHARNLRKGASKLIGFIGDEVITTPFAGDIVLGAQREAWRRGYVLLTIDTTGDANLEAAAISMMQEYRVAGVVYAAMYHRIVELPPSLSNMRVVCVNAQEATGRVTSIYPDEVKGGRDAAQLLIEAGHTDLAMINIGEKGTQLPAADGRLHGFCEQIDVHGLRLAEGRVRYGHGSFEDGLEHGLDLLGRADRPTAIFAGTDRTALGVYQAASRLGISIPEEVSVVGFDDQEFLRPFFTPLLTTFSLPHEKMGRRAVAELLSGRTSPHRVKIHCSLRQNQSVAPRKAKT